MLIIDSPSHNAFFNIASEEYLLHKFPKENIFLLYINEPSIIVGKFQNTLAEINLEYVHENHIKVVRRMSGGGAVYHDLGNLNFSFHTLLGNLDFMDFSMFTQPIISVLNRLNIPAKLEGRNDLLVDGRKFSGNAKLIKNGKMIQHGTILIDSQMKVLNNALKANPLKFVDKAVKSNRARVTNLIDYLPEGFTTLKFKELLVEEIRRDNPDAAMMKLSLQDMQHIERLVQEKYETWDWNFGFSPNYNFKKAIKIPAGFIELHLDVHKGLIQKAKIFGDFFASRSIRELEARLIGEKHQLTVIAEILKSVELTQYFGKVDDTEILELFE